VERRRHLLSHSGTGRQLTQYRSYIVNEDPRWTFMAVPFVLLCVDDATPRRFTTSLYRTWDQRYADRVFTLDHAGTIPMEPMVRPNRGESH
jgi:hypothetical protein